MQCNFGMAARNVRFEHEELNVISKSPMAQRVLDVCTVNRDRVGVLFINGRFIDTLAPGLYAFWKGQSEAKVVDARKAVSQTGDVRQALYRETQLVLRSVIGARELDAFLTEKDAVATETDRPSTRSL